MSLPNPYHHWRLITKVLIIANAMVWALLMGFVPNSLTYVVAHIHNAGVIPTYVLFIGIFVLTIDHLPALADVFAWPFATAGIAITQVNPNCPRWL